MRLVFRLHNEWAGYAFLKGDKGFRTLNSSDLLDFIVEYFPQVVGIATDNLHKNCKCLWYSAHPQLQGF